LNGTIYLLPYSRANTREVVERVHDEETNDNVGYLGDDSGDPVSVTRSASPASRAPAFAAAGANTTDPMRRFYVAEYVAEPILDEERSAPRHLADPLLIDGQRVR
jgi:hypothetical protein